MGDPQSGRWGCDERLSVAIHLNRGDEISIGVVVDLTDGCHIPLCLKEHHNLRHPDGSCLTEHIGLIHISKTVSTVAELRSSLYKSTLLLCVEYVLISL